MKKVYVAGHRGMVGGAIVRGLQRQGLFGEPCEILTSSRDECDLRNQNEVASYFSQHTPDYVFLAAAKVGGIHANNTFPAEFVYDNLLIQSNIIHCAWQHNVERLLFLGSSCIYPKHAPQPMAEEALLQGGLEPTNEPYAIAKIAGIKTCESYNRQYGTDFRSIMPTNLYGSGDNFHPENSHVVPALIRRFHEAANQNLPEVVVWGSGTPRREFLHVDDLASAALFVMEQDKAALDAVTTPMQSHLNVGVGTDVSIAELARMIAAVTGYQGQVVLDDSKPDGAPRKLLDVSKMQALGWSATIDLSEGLADALAWYKQNIDRARR